MGRVPAAAVALALVLIAAFALLAGPALADPTITKFRKGLSGHPFDIKAGPGHRMWFTEGGSDGAAAIGRISHKGRIHEYRTGLSGLMYAGNAAITPGPDGNLWFTESGHGSSAEPAGIIGRITPTGDVTEFRKGIGGQLDDITAGPDGNLWFTETSCSGKHCNARRGSIGRITPSGSVHVYSSSKINQPGGITTGPDGNLWFAGQIGFQGFTGLGRITPSGDLTIFDAAINGFPADILTGDDGNLWFSEFGHVGMAKIAQPADGPPSQKSYSIGKPQGYVHALAVGPDHNVWFAAQNERSYGRVGYVTPAGHVTRLADDLGNNSGDFLDGIAAGADGDIWLTDTGRNASGTIDRVNLK
jgi:virginiamycin B lyase